MKINVPIQEGSLGHGFIFDLDFSDYFLDYFGNTFGLTESLFNHMGGKLPQSKLRSVIDLYNLEDTSYFSFFKKYTNIDSLVNMITYSDSVKNQFNRLYPYRNYSTLKEFLEAYVDFGGMICYDKKGFELMSHVDNRLIMGSFVINIEDNQDSTQFWHYGQPYYKSPTEMGKGVFFFNTEETEHSIIVENQDLRKALIVNVTIRH